MPETLPDRLEAGTPNVPGISGLLEGLRFVEQKQTEQIRYHEQRLLRRLVNGLSVIPGIRHFAAEDIGLQTGVLSFLIDGVDCEVAAEALGKKGVSLRAGLHCAPLAHESVGTISTGTIRASFSMFNTEREVDQCLCILEHTGRKLRKGGTSLPQ